MIMSLIILSRTPYIAEHATRATLSIGDQTATLSLTGTGTIAGPWYNATLTNTALTGIIYLEYSEAAGHPVLEIETSNIKTFEIECRKLFEQKAAEIMYIDPDDFPDYYLEHWGPQQHNHVSVNILSDGLDTLEIHNAPRPTEVKINNQPYENYTYNSDSINTSIPEDNAAQNIDLWFNGTTSTTTTTSSSTDTSSSSSTSLTPTPSGAGTLSSDTEEDTDAWTPDTVQTVLIIGGVAAAGVGITYVAFIRPSPRLRGFRGWRRR